jgi:hypothetical protein
MTQKQELKAVSLQIAVGIIGNSADHAIETYLPLAEKIEQYLNPLTKNTGPSVTEVSFRV